VPYVDLNTIHNPATGTVAPATWGDQSRDNQEFLIDPPACSISQAANTSCADATITVLGTTATESFDNDAMHSDVTNRSRITIQTAGRYLFLARVSFAANSANSREVRFRIDGSTLVNGILLLHAGSATWRGSLTGMLVLSAGQYVECVANQNSGGALDAALVEFAATYLTR
jgi:hypothetical protein